MKKPQNPEDLIPVPFTIQVQSQIVKSLKQMEKNTRIPVDELATKALQMFIATHSDYMKGK